MKPKNFSKSVKKPKKRNQFTVISLLILGIALIPGAIFLNSFIQEEIDKGIEEQVLVPTSPSTNFLAFTTNDYPNAPPEVKTYYLWNLTNPDAFLSGEEKPKYEQVGPFTFRNWKYKYNISYDPFGTTVTYKEYDNYEQIGGENISEVYIININPAFLGGIAMAGGTERKYLELNFPLILSQVKETFKTMFRESMDETLSNHTWIENTLTELLKDCENLLGGFLGFPDDEVYELMLDSLNTSVLENYLRDGMPGWEEVFYEEWANDYFPKFEGNYTYLQENVEYRPGGAWADAIEDANIEILGDPIIQNAMNNATRKTSADLVDASGSLSGIGVDIDGALIGGSVPPEADLNITNTNSIETGRIVKTFKDPITGLLDAVRMDLPNYTVSGGTGLTFFQCDAIWNESDPLSLTGLDYEENQIWFNALYDDLTGQYARNNLTSHFGINSTQIQSILEWINTSISTWVPNAVEYQLNDWNSGVITNRTVGEWLFEANDTGVSTYLSYYGKDPSMARVNFFDDCENELEAEEAGIKTITIMTGKDNKYLARQVVKYDGKSTIDLWQTTETIRGSLGMYNTPAITEFIPPKIFNPDLMRVIAMVYIGKTSVFGVELNRFTFAPNTFSPNENYYMNTQGLINAQPVEKFKGVPVLISKPHFLDSNSRVINAIEGVQPNRIDHETYLDVEPISGVTMNARERVQVNFNLSSDEYFTSDINTTVMPIAWYERSGIVPKHLADRFTEEVYPAQTAQTYIISGGLVLGVVFAIAGGSGILNNEFKKSIIKKRVAPKSKKALKSNMNSLKSKMGYTVEEKKLKKKKLFNSSKLFKKKPIRTKSSKKNS